MQIEKVSKYPGWVIITNTFISTFTVAFNFAIVSIQNDEPFVRRFAYLTIWGMLFVWFWYLYITICFMANLKISYLLGDIAACFEFAIAPFYWFVLWANIASTERAVDIISDILVHLVCFTIIWIDVLKSRILFKFWYKYVLFFVLILYAINNYLWTIISEKPVYEPITWDNGTSYILIILAIIVSLLGHRIGILVNNEYTERIL